MRRLAFALGLACVLTACGGSSGAPGVERTLSAAGSESESLPAEATTSTTPTTSVPAVSSTVRVSPSPTAGARPLRGDGAGRG